MNKKILIIDDDIMTLRALKRALEEEFEIQLENAGYRFVEHMTDYHADMILLDIDMPVMSGMEVFDAFIKADRPMIPVVFLSDQPNAQVIREAMAKGAAGYLPKSAQKAEIVSKVKQIFLEFSGNREKPHVLILGNDVTAIRVAKLDLEDAKYRVSCVFSVAEALEILRRESVDAFLITEPVLNVSEQEICETLCKKLGARSLPAVYGLNSFSKEQLLDKVGKAVGR
ncbi:MAG: response regulator [Lachnospiraceae bacterium]|nr:response regulator [Lachnospiraceae bacterium]